MELRSLLNLHATVLSVRPRKSLILFRTTHSLILIKYRALPPLNCCATQSNITSQSGTWTHTRHFEKREKINNEYQQYVCPSRHQTVDILTTACFET